MVEKSSMPPTYDEVQNICKSVLDEVIGQSSYMHTESVKWTSKVVETITEKLVSMERHFKYCVTCVIMQSGLGAGLNMSSTCYWNRQTDFAFAVRWESKAVFAVCNVFAIAFNPETEMTS
ncbi:tctex-1 family domain-containing protein [Ditylenchus destructor]|uniref:Tctex-1 family domain-containing protein n=1 Tax=Ditylenchus destructor TaxID=166010 RepID=A0AAD4NA34_9BILA|nr:tctex-1 family domain-containing protein [Ditylenchus destructor]